MPSAYVVEWGDARIDVLAEFGEDFVAYPVAAVTDDDDRDVNDVDRPDLCRPPIPVTLIYHEKGKTYRPAARGVAENMAQQRVGAEIMIQAWHETLPWEPRQGDRFVRAQTGVAYRAARFEPDDVGWMWFVVTGETA